MYLPLQFTLESHATAATLYLHGTLQPQSAVGAFRSCYQLPPAVRRLTVDLRGVHDTHPGAADTLAILLHEWETVRRGAARAEPVPAALRAP